MKSPKYSFKGFKISKNFTSAVKKTAYVMIPALITELVSNNIISTSLAGIIGPMILNAIEYYFKKY
jgi:hypothetical protein